jgi:hypothetical protein
MGNGFGYRIGGSENFPLAPGAQAFGKSSALKRQSYKLLICRKTNHTLILDSHQRITNFPLGPGRTALR